MKKRKIRKYLEQEFLKLDYSKKDKQTILDIIQNLNNLDASKKETKLSLHPLHYLFKHI